jgi:hypothetical protein
MFIIQATGASDYGRIQGLDLGMDKASVLSPFNCHWQKILKLLLTALFSAFGHQS